MEETAPHILVVDDHREIRDLLGRYLARQGYRVSLAESALAARRVIEAGAVALVVLDIMMPGEDGLSLCRWLRERHDLPVILLTAVAEDTDRIIGLEMGADDYVTKPFNPRELLARMRAVMRRAQDRGLHHDAGSKTLHFAGWTLEAARRRLLNPDGVEVALTGGEYDLLVALLDRANKVVTRDMLLDLLRGRQAGPFDRAIDVAISRLRRKLDDDGRHAQLIKTVRGGGYVLAAEVRRG